MVKHLGETGRNGNGFHQNTYGAVRFLQVHKVETKINTIKTEIRRENTEESLRLEE